MVPQGEPCISTEGPAFHAGINATAAYGERREMRRKYLMLSALPALPNAFKKMRRFRGTARELTAGAEQALHLVMQPRRDRRFRLLGAEGNRLAYMNLNRP